VYLFELLLNGWTDIDEIVCVCLSGSLDGLDLQLDPVDPTRRGAQKGILRFTLSFSVYKWQPLVTWADEVKGELSRLWF